MSNAEQALAAEEGATAVSAEVGSVIAPSRLNRGR